MDDNELTKQLTLKNHLPLLFPSFFVCQWAAFKLQSQLGAGTAGIVVGLLLIWLWMGWICRGYLGMGWIMDCCLFSFFRTRIMFKLSFVRSETETEWSTRGMR